MNKRASTWWCRCLLRRPIPRVLPHPLSLQRHPRCLPRRFRQFPRIRPRQRKRFLPRRFRQFRRTRPRQRNPKLQRHPLSRPIRRCPLDRYSPRDPLTPRRHRLPPYQDRRRPHLPDALLLLPPQMLRLRNPRPLTRRTNLLSRHLALGAVSLDRPGRRRTGRQ
jgi:hypothetical protein